MTTFSSLRDSLVVGLICEVLSNRLVSELPNFVAEESSYPNSSNHIIHGPWLASKFSQHFVFSSESAWRVNNSSLPIMLHSSMRRPFKSSVYPSCDCYTDWGVDSVARCRRRAAPFPPILCMICKYGFAWYTRMVVLITRTSLDSLPLVVSGLCWRDTIS